MRRGRDNVGVLEGRGDEAGGDEAGDVGHVGEEPWVLKVFLGGVSKVFFFEWRDCRGEQGEQKESAGRANESKRGHRRARGSEERAKGEQQRARRKRRRKRAKKGEQEQKEGASQSNNKEKKPPPRPRLLVASAEKNPKKNEKKPLHSPGPVLVGDLPHARVVVVPRVRRRARHHALGPEQRRGLLELVVVDEAGRLVEAVGHRLEKDRRRRDALGVGLVAVGEVAAVREVEAHDAVVRVEQGGVDLRREWGWWGCVFLLFLLS